MLAVHEVTSRPGILLGQISLHSSAALVGAGLGRARHPAAPTGMSTEYRKGVFKASECLQGLGTRHALVLSASLSRFSKRWRRGGEHSDSAQPGQSARPAKRGYTQRPETPKEASCPMSMVTAPGRGPDWDVAVGG